jgi:hypothetical protein
MNSRIVSRAAVYPAPSKMVELALRPAYSRNRCCHDLCAGVTGSRDSLTSQPGVAPPVPNTCPSAEDHSDACASRSCSPPVLVQRGNPPGRLAKQLVITPVASHLAIRMFLARQLPLDYAPFSTSNANETSTAYSASAEHFQQCAKFPLLHNRGLSALAVTVLPIALARRATATACAAVQSTAPPFRRW